MRPGGEQLVRLVRASREPAAIEKSYRLVIDEIPDPSTPAVNGVVLRLRYSVPVFVAGATPEPRPELSWKAAREGKEWVLSLNNTGTRYAQVASLQVLDSGGKPVAEVDGLVGCAGPAPAAVAHPGRPAAPGPVRIKALINGGTISATPRMD